MSRPVTDHDYELLSAYLDGTLSESEHQVLETRLQNEPSLRRELDALRQTVALVKQLPPLKAPRNFTLDIHMVRPSRLLIFPTTTAFSALSAIAAILVLVVAGLLLMTPSLSQAPPEPQSLASIPTHAITAESEDGAANVFPSRTATIALPTQAASPFEAPEEAAGAAAMDEQESADTLALLPTASPLPPPAAGMAAPVTAGEDQAAQSEPGSQSQQTMEQMQQAAPTQMLGTTTLNFAATAAPDDLESATANRLLTEETSPALSDGFTVSQAESTPELQENEEVPAPTMTATLPPTSTPTRDSRLEDRSQGIPLASVLLAVGILLLILAAATTIARRRR